MLLIVHAVSRQLTTGSLPTQLVLTVWGTDVQTDLLSFCRAEAHCYMWPNSTFVLDRKNVLLSSQVTISASTDRSTFRLMNAFVFWKSFNLLLFSQPFISDTLESMVFIKMDFIKVFLFVWFFLKFRCLMATGSQFRQWGESEIAKLVLCLLLLCLLGISLSSCLSWTQIHMQSPSVFLSYIRAHTHNCLVPISPMSFWILEPPVSQPHQGEWWQEDEMGRGGWGKGEGQGTQHSPE